MFVDTWRISGVNLTKAFEKGLGSIKKNKLSVVTT